MKLSKLDESRLRRALKALDVLSAAATRAADKVDELARVHGAWDYRKPGFPSDYHERLERERLSGDVYHALGVDVALARVAQAASLASAAACEAGDRVALFQAELDRLTYERQRAAALEVREFQAEQARIRKAEASAGGDDPDFVDLQKIGPRP